MKCKICGKNADSEYCFQHKPRKSLPKTQKSYWLPTKPVQDGEGIRTHVQMHDFFMSLWNKRRHYCENCGRWLGNEPLSYMFDHLLEKSKYPELKFEELNIFITCLECHGNKTQGSITEIVKERIKIVREVFGK